MIIIVIKEPDVESPCAEQIRKEYPDSSIFRYKQYSDQELLEAISGPALIVLNHKMAIPHVKLLRAAASDHLVRLMVVLEDGFAVHAVNARIAGADVCLSMPYEPTILLRAIEDEGSTLRRMSEAVELIKSQACINRRYTLTRMLGAGRHSVMFLAQDLRSNITITLKLLRKSLASSQEFMAEFQSTAEKFKLINTPSMVSVLDYGSWNGYAYLALNIGKGENLYEVMAKRKLEPQEIARVGLAITRAMIAIKKQAVLHFDIKPENIIFYKDNYYLSEFGSMIPFNKPDCSGYYYWPDSAYTSPESFVDDASFTIRSDVYSLGLILYVLARRENPFAGHPCTYELSNRVSENMVNFLEENPLESCPPLAITIEAMTLCRHDARPRLRDLEIIFYQLVVMLSGKPSTELPGFSALQTSRATTISSAAADSEQGQKGTQVVAVVKSGEREYLSRTSGRRFNWAVFSDLPLKKKFLLLFSVLVLFSAIAGAGYWYGRNTVVRKHFQQGPLQMFTCYNGHSKALRTLDLRNVYCPECGENTSPSYTCNKCQKIFGLTLWPRRDMTDKECEDFEEKQAVCPFCKSTDIKPTPLQEEKTTSSKKK